MNNLDIWKKEEAFDQKLYDNIDSFFEKLHGSKELEYRESQHTMALDIMDAIKKREILLIEAGVGSGKSWGYLVPLIYASMDKENFRGFIISTSSIALEEQLKREINRLSELLETNLDVTVAKGRNNYICKRRLEQFLKQGSNKSTYSDVIQKTELGKIDRCDFDEIPQQVWKKINVDKVRCTNCMYAPECNYVLQRKQMPTEKFVICNHDLLVEALKRDNEDKILKEPSILIVDEAHTLEEKIRNSYQKSITKPELEALIYHIYMQIYDTIDGEIPAINTLNQVFRKISTKAKREYKANSLEDIDVLDSETSGFTCTPKIKEEISLFITQLDEIEETTNSLTRLDKKLINQLSSLKEAKRVFEDLIKENRENIYIAAFLPNTKEHIELQYIPKNIAKEATKLLSNPTYGKVFTSATLTTKKDDYSYFRRGLGLDNMIGIPVSQEFSQPSPYDYDSNALLYCAPDVVSPRSKDHDLYLDSLTTKIEDLLQITEGRSLILFTSKKDMEDVYKRLQCNKHSFNILIQESGKNSENLKTKFKEDETSTLLATGSFWEGIDIKGSTLENVIITKLPFPVVDPIMQEKASYFANGFEEVYLPEMLLKLKQGTGRLIRGTTDKGIVAILDSRVKDYITPITNSLPFNNITGKISDVKKFAQKNLSVGKTEDVVKQIKKVDIKK